MPKINQFLPNYRPSIVINTYVYVKGLKKVELHFSSLPPSLYHKYNKFFTRDLYIISNRPIVSRYRSCLRIRNCMISGRRHGQYNKRKRLEKKKKKRYSFVKRRYTTTRYLYFTISRTQCIVESDTPGVALFLSFSTYELLYLPAT